MSETPARSEGVLSEDEAAELNAVIEDSGEIWGLTESLSAAVEAIIAERMAVAWRAGYDEGFRDGGDNYGEGYYEPDANPYREKP